VRDVGAGDGAYALALGRRGARVTGLDASPRALRAVAAQPPDSGTSVWTAPSLRRLARGAGLVPGRVRGAVFHPPLGLAARALAPCDPLLERATTLGAAFLAMEADKPGNPSGP
jgi:predicted RNA methylase